MFKNSVLITSEEINHRNVPSLYMIILQPIIIQDFMHIIIVNAGVLCSS